VKLCALVSELQHTQSLKGRVKEKDLRVIRKRWFSRPKSSWTRHQQLQIGTERLLVLSMVTQGHTFLKKILVLSYHQDHQSKIMPI